MRFDQDDQRAWYAGRFGKVVHLFSGPASFNELIPFKGNPLTAIFRPVFLQPFHFQRPVRRWRKGGYAFGCYWWNRVNRWQRDCGLWAFAVGRILVQPTAQSCLVFGRKRNDRFNNLIESR